MRLSRSGLPPDSATSRREGWAAVVTVMVMAPGWGVYHRDKRTGTIVPHVRRLRHRQREAGGSVSRDRSLAAASRVSGEDAGGRRSADPGARAHVAGGESGGAGAGDHAGLRVAHRGRRAAAGGWDA